VEADGAVKSLHQIGQLRDVLVRPDRVAHLVGDGHDLTRLVGQRCLDHVNQVLAILQPLDDLRRRLAAVELAEEFLDVLDLQRALFERVLLDHVLQQEPPEPEDFTSRRKRRQDARAKALAYARGAAGRS
jgi:hypothetical protein